jgi:hypothetical protein
MLGAPICSAEAELTAREAAVSKRQMSEKFDQIRGAQAKACSA